MTRPKPDLRPFLGQRVRVVVDRPLGSRHPRHPELVYPMNYGELPGTVSGDGHPVDAYLLGWPDAVPEAEGVVVAVLEREDDAEDKLVVVRDGAPWDGPGILAATAFQERFFRVRLHLWGASSQGPASSGAVGRGAGDGVPAALRRGLARIPHFIGPAVIASIAYMDPGNFATNIQAGADFGYRLIWVILAANLMAMVIQNLSAKLGIATGRSLPQVIRDQFPGPLVWFYWVQAELVAMATDLAEFIGAAVAVHLLTGLPLIFGGGVAAVISFWVLNLQKRGARTVELVIGAFVLTIGVAYLVQFVLAHPEFGALGTGFRPSFAGQDSVYLAMGIIGATVMPHVIYLHSALTRGRTVVKDDTEKLKLSRLNRVDVIGAMGFAGVINMAMLAVSAATFHERHVVNAGDLETAYQTLTPLLGSAAGVAFAIALLASGLSSSVVGTMAGDIVMQGFVGFSVPLWLRRTLTMLPAFVVIALGLDASKTLVLSQVVLSFGVPFALVPLLLFTARRELMGVLVNRAATTVLGWSIAVLIIGLNLFLLWGLFTG